MSHNGLCNFFFFFQAEDGIRDHCVTGVRRVLFRSMMELAQALQINLDNYAKQFGPPTPPPVPPNDRRPTIQEVYENFKLPDDLMSGAYANSVLIGHSPTEFFFDFITGFYPTSAVSARVFLPAPQVPKFLTTLQTCIQQHQARQNNRPPEK